MKVTIEIECENQIDLRAKLLHAAGVSEGYYICRSRLGLVKEIRDLYNVAWNRHEAPTLSELRDAVWKHVIG
jgi:hypothetical protein